MAHIRLAFLLCFSALTSIVQSAEVQRTILIRGDSSVPARESIVANVEIAQGASVGRHTHFGDEIGYVQEGELEMYVDGDMPRKLKAGDAFIITSGKAHDARNVGTITARITVIYVVEKNRPLATPTK